MKNSVIKRCIEHLMSFFDDVAVIDEAGNTQGVPLIYGDYKAAKEWGFLVADQFHGDPKMFFSTQRFPVMSLELVRSDFEKDDPELTFMLNALTIFQEDMNQIVEQILAKFSDRSHYTLDSVINNEDVNAISCKAKRWQFTVKLSLEGHGSTREVSESDAG